MKLRAMGRAWVLVGCRGERCDQPEMTLVSTGNQSAVYDSLEWG